MVVINRTKNTGKSAVALAMVALVSLGACGTQSALLTGSISSMRGPAFDKYPIQVVAEKEGLTIVVKPHVFALSQDDEKRVAWLAESYKHVGHGEIWVVAPTGSANSAASIGAAAQIAKVMVDQGIRPTDIRMNSYQASATDTEAPVTVLFKRYHAYTDDCGNWTKSVAHSPLNATSQNLGCASHSNLAALVVDPYDLLEPKAIDPADPARRSTVFMYYREGNPTASRRIASESGVVSGIAEND
jgi:pilus assembly protein CpaD